MQVHPHSLTGMKDRGLLTWAWLLGVRPLSLRWVGPVMGMAFCSHPHTCPFIHGCLLYKLSYWKSLGAAGLLLAPARA